MGVPWSLYAAHTLSTWGDNMWWFAGAVPVILHHYDSDDLYYDGVSEKVAATCWSCSPHHCDSPPSMGLSLLQQVKSQLTKWSSTI